MDADSEENLRKTGERLAGLLGQFIDAEYEDFEDRAHVLLAVYAYFEAQTAMHRRPGYPWPPEAMHRPGEWPDPDMTS